jgi:hypothetical protein
VSISLRICEVFVHVGKESTHGSAGVVDKDVKGSKIPDGRLNKLSAIFRQAHIGNDDADLPGLRAEVVLSALPRRSKRSRLR